MEKPKYEIGQTLYWPYWENEVMSGEVAGIQTDGNSWKYLINRDWCRESALYPSQEECYSLLLRFENDKHERVINEILEKWRKL